MWTYRSSDGELCHDGVFRGTGYSGAAEGRNNPGLESMQSIGPIPRGRYRIGAPYTSEHLGPLVMALDPVGHSAYGRTLFRIHGDNARHDASHGCIVLGPGLRQEIAGSADTELEVV
jgi:lipoprotein-anchoring transpeptidase ErfK/SrfK